MAQHNKTPMCNTQDRTDMWQNHLCTIKASINGSLYAMMTRPLTVQYANTDRRCKKESWLWFRMQILWCICLWLYFQCRPSQSVRDFQIYFKYFFKGHAAHLKLKFSTKLKFEWSLYSTLCGSGRT